MKAPPRRHLLPLLLILPGCAQDEPQRPPPSDPTRVREAIAILDEAFRHGDHAAQVSAVDETKDVLLSEAAGRVFRGLGELGTAEKGIELMRWLPRPYALEVLHEVYTIDMLEGDAELYERVIRAIGQHGSEASVELLADPTSTNTDPRVLRARLFGLGRVRCAPALDGLFALLGRQLEPAQRAALMDEFRISAILLTGADRGESAEAWRTWREEHAAFVVPAEVPALPAELQARWDAYWSTDG